MIFRLPDPTEPLELPPYDFTIDELIAIYKSEGQSEFGERLRIGLFAPFAAMGIEAPEDFVAKLTYMLESMKWRAEQHGGRDLEITIYPPSVSSYRGQQLAWELAMRDTSKANDPSAVSWHGTNLSQVVFNCGIVATLKNSTVPEAMATAENREEFPLEISVSIHT